MSAITAFIYIPQQPLYVAFFVVLAFSLYAQFRVSSAYAKNSKILSRGGISGREAAAAVMANAGITGVEIEETGGRLTDHYDPAKKILVLSSENYRGTSLAAVGVAAHEAGHALQHKEGYSLLEFRMALAPMTIVASRVIMILFFASFFLFRGLSGPILEIAILAFAIMTVFQLVTLPVEYDASRRAKAQLVSLGILDADEMPGVNQVLDAAALTYLAAFVLTLINLLSLLSRRN